MKNLIKKLLLRKNVLFIYFFLLLLIILSSFFDKNFMTFGNLTNIFTNALPLLLVAIGQTLVILTGGIDLSVGGIVSVTNVIIAVLINDERGFLLGLVVTLIIGLLAGLINGLIIVKGKQQPLIVTIATQAIFFGIALSVLSTGGGQTNTKFAELLTGNIFRLPISILITFIILFLVSIVLNKSQFGRFVLAIGGNETASYSSGISVQRIKIYAYMISGFFSALAGIYLNAIIYSGDPLIGTDFTLLSITAVVLGGTILAGGSGGVSGTFAGVFIIYIINNILNLVNITSFYQYIISGSILVIALAFSSLRTKKFGTN